MANPRIDNYDYRKIFVYEPRFITMVYTNSTGSEVTLGAGRLMGRIASSQKALPHVSTATDGSEQPVGFCADGYVVANGATINITVCTSGGVAEEMITLGGSDTLDTVVQRTYTDSGTDTVAVSYGSIRDLIQRNTQCFLVKGTDLTGYDNQ